MIQKGEKGIIVSAVSGQSHKPSFIFLLFHVLKCKLRNCRRKVSTKLSLCVAVISWSTLER